MHRYRYQMQPRESLSAVCQRDNFFKLFITVNCHFWWITLSQGIDQRQVFYVEVIS